MPVLVSSRAVKTAMSKADVVLGSGEADGVDLIGGAFGDSMSAGRP